jgi:c-di-GMP-binding flagellar brake protein YcgR
MFDQTTTLPSGQLDTAALDALCDLERNKSETVKQARTSARVRIRAAVVAEPGNAGERQRFSVKGVTGDISAGGCQLLFPLPMRVGDFYLLTFERNQLRLEPLLARCLRVRLVREDAFEAGFKFLQPIDISDALGHASDDSLFE